MQKTNYVTNGTRKSWQPLDWWLVHHATTKRLAGTEYLEVDVQK